MHGSLISDPEGTTKIHLVSLEDGSLKTFDSGIWSFVFHFGNAIERGGKIIIDAPAYENS